MAARADKLPKMLCGQVPTDAGKIKIPVAVKLAVPVGHLDIILMNYINWIYIYI